jgi:lambda family phage minor tail protein L
MAAFTPITGSVPIAGNATTLRIRNPKITPSTKQIGLVGNAVVLRREIKPRPWLDNTAFSVGDIVRPFTNNGAGFYFRCTVAGTSGATEPFWPTIIANTVVDGTVTWMAVSIIAGEFQTAAPSTIIELFELQLNSLVHGSNELYRFHAGSSLNGNGEVVWAGRPYLRFPIEADGFEYDGQGQLPRPKLRVSNVLGSITAILLSLPRGIEGAKITRIRTLARYIDDTNFAGGINPYGTPDSSAEFPREIYYIDRKSAENRELVEFELLSAFDLAGVRVPKRQCIANICQWVYRSAECSYTGTNYFNSSDTPVASLSQDACGKRLSSCRARFGENAELPFGSFPGIGSASS